MGLLSCEDQDTWNLQAFPCCAGVSSVIRDSTGDRAVPLLQKVPTGL